jgi:late competence protein required for DNA uptake (superfamily II DNA/RNA helicase)
MEVMTMGVRVMEDKKGIRVFLGNTEVKGYRDDSGVYYLTRCTRCGTPVKQYVSKRGPKRLYCDNCRSTGNVKVEGNKILTKKAVLEIIEE